MVITILAILWAITFISFQWYAANSRDSVRIQDISSINKVLELFTLEKWFYPGPTSGVEVTYSWWEVWTQWTFWDSVMQNVWKLNKKPVDPLFETEYTYSVTNLKTEYEIWWISESWVTAKINLLTKQVTAYNWYTALKWWNYNWQILRVSTWWTDYILAIPSIISSNLTNLEVESIVNNQALSFKNLYNLPNSYENTIEGWSATWWFSYNPWLDLIIFSSNLIDLWTSTWRILFTQRLQKAYSWSFLQTDDDYAPLLSFDANNDSSASDIYAWHTIRNVPQFPDNLTDQVAKSIPQLTWWRALDLNCDVDDIIIWSQVWAGCNSALWNWFERWQVDWDIWTSNYNWILWSCYNYGEIVTSSCTVGSNNMASNTKENIWFPWVTWNGDSAADNIWWKLYTGTNAPSWCISWYHLPTDAEWETLETTLNGSNCRNSTNGWLCDGLGWNLHSTKNASNNIVKALKIPLPGYRHIDSTTFHDRGATTFFWSGTIQWDNRYIKLLNSSNSTVNRYTIPQTLGVSVRCIKD